MYPFQPPNPASSSARLSSPSSFTSHSSTLPGATRAVLSWPLDKYSFADTSSASGLSPQRDIKWTHWPHRDQLFLVLNVPREDGQKQRGVGPLSAGLGPASVADGVRMKVVYSVQTMHDLDLTALVRRNVMAEGQWQPGVLLLGRAPCLAVKYVKDREDKCQRFQVRFKDTKDYEAVKETLERFGIPVKMRTQDKEGPVPPPPPPLPPLQQQTQFPGRIEISQQQQQYQASQSTQALLGAVQFSQGQPHQYPTHPVYQQPQQYHGSQQHQQQLFTMSQPTASAPPYSALNSFHHHAPLNHQSLRPPYECRPPLAANSSSQSRPPHIHETPTPVRTNSHLPSPPGSSQSFYHPSHPSRSSGNPAFDPIDDLDDELPPPRPPVAFTTGKAAPKRSNEAAKLNKPTPIIPPVVDSGTDESIIASSKRAQGAATRGDNNRAMEILSTACTLKSMATECSRIVQPLGSADTPGQFDEPVAAASAKKTSKPRKSATTTTKPRGKKTQSAKAVLAPAPTSSTSNSAARKRRKVEKQVTNDDTADEEEDPKEPSNKIPDIEKDNEDNQDELRKIEEMMVEALKNEDFLRLCERVSKVWGNIGMGSVGLGN